MEIGLFLIEFSGIGNILIQNGLVYRIKITIDLIIDPVTMVNHSYCQIHQVDFYKFH
jgi:hypothetical protein